MIEFAIGTQEQYQKLDQELCEGKIYKFPNRMLPDGCEPDTACFWFGKENGTYRVCVDRGIQTDIEDPAFRSFLERGGAKFMTMDDVAEFFHSLQYIFPNHQAYYEHRYRNRECPMVPDINNPTLPYRGPRQTEANIVDRQKLKAIREDDSKRKMVRPESLSVPLKEKVFGQDAVIDAIAQMVVINQMRKDKKLLAIALLGPTGTGKSETAKSLAQVMTDAYGTEYGFIEIAGSELEGEQSIHRFLGAPPGYVGHGQPTLLDPVRENPYHIIVINEIEKADEKILVGLMEAIDTGKLGMADNSRPIELNRCVMIFTSNLPIDMVRYESCSEFERAEMCRDAFTKFCGRPEISGKIGNFLAFSPLTEDAKTDVVVKFVREVLESYDMKLAHIDEHLMLDFLKRQTKYGARGIRVFVENALGRYILRASNLDEYANKEVSLRGTIENIVFEIV